MGIADMDKGDDKGAGLPDQKPGTAGEAAVTGAVDFFASDGARLYLVSPGGLALMQAAGDTAAGWRQIAPQPPGFVPVAAKGADGVLLLWSAAGEAWLFAAESGFQPCILPSGQRVRAGVVAQAGACLLIGPDEGPLRAVLATRDLATPWRDLPALPTLAEPADTAPALFATADRLWLASCGDRDGVEGFSLWSLDLAAETAVWDLRLPRGAGRSAMNFRISALCGIDDGSTLIATLPAADQPLSGLDHPGSELIVLPPDGGWDLVIGEARFSPEGLKIPFSLTGEGFETPDSSWITALAVSGGTIAALCRDPLGVEPPVLRLCRDAAALEGWEILHSGDLPALVATAAVDPASAGLFAVGSGLAMTQGASVRMITDPAQLR